MNPDEAQEIEQAFLASWDRIEGFFGIQYLKINDDGSADEINVPFAEAEAWLSNLDSQAPNVIKQYYDFKKPIRPLIIEMRKRGYDRQLRAGQAMLTLVLSRSRKHGLRQGQPQLRFEWSDTDMTVLYSELPDVRIEIEAPTVELTPEVEQLLAKLLTQPID